MWYMYENEYIVIMYLPRPKTQTMDTNFIDTLYLDMVWYSV